MIQGDYYSLLEVSRSASDEEIKHAYRRLVRKWHPDLNPGLPEAEERLTRLNEAYRVLRDHDSRRNYDRMIFAALASHSTTFAPAWMPVSVHSRRRMSVTPLIASLFLLGFVLAMGVALSQPPRIPLEWQVSYYSDDSVVARHVTGEAEASEISCRAAATYWEREMRIAPSGDLARYNLASVYGELASISRQRGDEDQATAYSKAAQELFSSHSAAEFVVIGS